MKTLAIDTSAGICSVAISCDGKIIASGEENLSAKQAERLFPIIEKLLKKVSFNYSDLDLVAVTIGPGSFTGIRIGMAAAKGISIASELPTIGVTTLEAIAWQAKENSTNILAILNAMRGQVYVQKFSIREEIINHESKAALINIEDISTMADKDAFIACNCPDIAGEALGVKHTISDKIAPHASSIISIAEYKFNNGEKNPFVPLYIRKPDAKKPRAA